MKLGLTISTFSNENTDPARYNTVVKDSLDSLISCNVQFYVNIVTDTVTPTHLELLQKYPFKIIQRPQNGGISKCKNTGIKDLHDNGCDIFFVADDDIIYTPGCFEKYIDAMNKTGIQHFSWFDFNRHDRKELTTINNFNVLRTFAHNGVFLVFTRNVVESIGYYKETPYNYGYEHAEYTNRCIKYEFAPFIADICDSNDYIKLHSLNIVSQTHQSVNIQKNAIIMNNDVKYIEFHD